MACDDSRFDAIIEKKVPLVLRVGALDMVNFGAKDTIPQQFQQKIYMSIISRGLILTATIFSIGLRMTTE